MLNKKGLLKLINEEIRLKSILMKTKNYTLDLGNAERLRGYLQALYWIRDLLT